MNKKEALAILEKNLDEYLSHGFVFHPRFLEEFKNILKNAKGHEAEIFSLLIKQFDFVKILGTQVNEADSNELIRYQTRDFYSLHLSAKNFNLRLLMTFYNDNPVFLVAFYERSGKKKTNYSQYNELLIKRLEELIEGGVLK